MRQLGSRWPSISLFIAAGSLLFNVYLGITLLRSQQNITDDAVYKLTVLGASEHTSHDAIGLPLHELTEPSGSKHGLPSGAKLLQSKGEMGVGAGAASPSQEGSTGSKSTGGRAGQRRQAILTTSTAQPLIPEKKSAIVDKNQATPKGAETIPRVDPAALAKANNSFSTDTSSLCAVEDDHRAMVDELLVWKTAEMGLPRLLCLLHTKKTDAAVTRSIRQTWGKKCDGYLSMGDVTDGKASAVSIMRDDGEPGTPWQQVQAIWQYVSMHHLTDYDYFLLGDDQLFVVVENLRLYLQTDQIRRATDHGQKPVYLGRRFQLADGQVYNTGGAGYVLNVAALRVLVDGIKSEKPECDVEQTGPLVDQYVARCLKASGVHPLDTRDSLMRERFMPFSPAQHLSYHVNKTNPDWFAQYTAPFGEMKEGIAGVHPHVISFSYMTGSLMNRAYALFYKLCGPPTMDALVSKTPLADPTVLTRLDVPFDANLTSTCAIQDDNNKMIESLRVAQDSQMGQPRLLCLSYTISTAHDGAVKRVRQTWGRRCDGYLAMSNLTDLNIPSVDIKHRGPEAYDNMWQKSRSIWLYVHAHHAKQYDYFVIGGDDLFILVENLRLYLRSEEIVNATANGTEPIYLGRRFHTGEGLDFNSGGAGYVLNSAALEVLVHNLQNEVEGCPVKQRGFWEDTNVAKCLQASGVKPYDTRDSMGRERFMPFSPAIHFTYKLNKTSPDWFGQFTLPYGELLEGAEGVSPNVISFHYIKGDLMDRLYAQFYGLCNSTRGSGEITTNVTQPETQVVQVL